MVGEVASLAEGGHGGGDDAARLVTVHVGLCFGDSPVLSGTERACSFLQQIVPSELLLPVGTAAVDGSCSHRYPFIFQRKLILVLAEYLRTLGHQLLTLLYHLYLDFHMLGIVPHHFLGFLLLIIWAAVDDPRA